MSSSRIFRHPRRGFTLPEAIFAVTISALVVAAAATLTTAGLKTFFLESDFQEINGESRRLTDDLTEGGTLADDLAVFRDLNELVLVPAGDRGDCLVFFTRDSDSSNSVADGAITSFICYYLAPVNRAGSRSTDVCLWRSTASVTSGYTSDATTALQNYARTGAKRVTGVVFSGSLPRPMPALTNPITPRAGVFTNDGFRSGGAPTALVTLPANVPARVGSPVNASSNLTFAVTPRH